MSTAAIAGVLALALALAVAGCGGNTRTVVVTRTAATGASSATGVNFGATTKPTGIITTTLTATGTSTTGSVPTSTQGSTTAPPKPTPTIRISDFRSPSGNIGCIVLADGARCDIRQRNWSPPPRPASCPNVVAFGQGMAVNTSGAGKFVCAGDTSLNPGARALAYGTATSFQGFRCASSTSGMTCTNERTGHGFFISIQGYRSF
ncbi:MAG: DUF6636 domain-containing protein [Solirubrobacteraceae bacterium]